MKQENNYEVLEIQIISFDAEDVILTSDDKLPMEEE